MLGWNALVIACGVGNVQIINALLAHPALEINSENGEGKKIIFSYI